MKIIKLLYPIVSSGLTITEVKIRRPKVKDIRAVKKTVDTVETEIALFANLCEISPDEIEMLDMEDYTQLQSAFQGFLGTGEK